MEKQYIESEYDNFRLIAPYKEEKIIPNSNAFVFDQDEKQWYLGKTIAIEPEGNPENMSGSYCGEFIIGENAFAVSIDAAERIKEPEDIKNCITLYC